MRRPYMTFAIVLLNEMIFKPDANYEGEIIRLSTIIRGIEVELHNFQVKELPVIKKYQMLSKKLDSDNFCDYIKDRINEDTYKSCITYNTGTMLRGFKTNIYQILANIEFLLNSLQQLKAEGHSPNSLIHDSKLDFIGVVKTNFMNPAYLKLTETFKEETESYLNRIKLWTSVKNSCFLAIAILIYVLIFIRFMKQLQSEIWETKGLLTLIPISLISSNPDLKSKYLEHQNL